MMRTICWRLGGPIGINSRPPSASCSGYAFGKSSAPAVHDDRIERRFFRQTQRAVVDGGTWTLS